MSTSYIISLGYASGYSSRITVEDAYNALHACVSQLRYQPGRIIAEARRLNAPETCKHGCCTLQSAAEAYQLEENGPIVYHPESQCVSQLTTGGDRALKEHVRRAFCRLVIEEMHRQNIEVDLTVS